MNNEKILASALFLAQNQRMVSEELCRHTSALSSLGTSYFIFVSLMRSPFAYAATRHTTHMCVTLLTTVYGIREFEGGQM